MFKGIPLLYFIFFINITSMSNRPKQETKKKGGFFSCCGGEEDKGEAYVDFQEKRQPVVRSQVPRIL